MSSKIFGSGERGAGSGVRGARNGVHSVVLNCTYKQSRPYEQRSQTKEFRHMDELDSITENQKPPGLMPSGIGVLSLVIVNIHVVDAIVLDSPIL